jgi:hypothetical protein
MNPRLQLATVSLVLSYFAASASPRFQFPQHTNLALIALAVLSFGWFIVEEVRLIRGLDELQRRIQLEALAITYPLCILLVATLGLLQRVITLPAGDLSYRHVWPIFILFYFVGLMIARGRYR